MNNTKTLNTQNFFQRLRLKLFFSEMSTSKIVVQSSIAGLLIALACILERFVMVKAGPFEMCIGFFVVLLFPLLLDFRIATLAAMLSVTITELAISGEGTFWAQYLPILLSFPIIKAFMLFDKKWLYALGVVVAMTLYVLVASLMMYAALGKGFGIIYLWSKCIQMVITIPMAILLYYPIKRVVPSQTDNSWEKDLCCVDCVPSVNKDQQCCDDNCEDDCRNK